jgi:hypothetical protein
MYPRLDFYTFHVIDSDEKARRCVLDGIMEV